MNPVKSYQGKFVIVAMVSVGLAMAAFAWWTRYSHSQQVLATWGRDAAVAIRSGEKVDLLRLGPSGTNSDSVAEEIMVQPENVPEADWDAEKRVVTGSTDITKAAGLIHARHHLLHEKGFDWDTPRAGDCKPNWEVAMRFRDGNNVATMLLDFQCDRAYLLERRVEVGMAPISPALQKFLSDFDK